MQLEQLTEQRTKMLLERSSAKDAVEGIERQLGALALAIQTAEAYEADIEQEPAE